MTDFMQGRPVPVDRFEIGLRRWNLHEVVPRIVERPLAADPEVHAGCTDQRLGLRQDEIGFDRRRDRHDIRGQALALRHVENSEALEERDRLRFVAGLCGPAALVVRSEPVSIHDGRAALALADMAAEAERLAEGQPTLARKAELDDGAPKNEHINPGVASLGCGILGHGERRFRRRCPPGLDPWRTAGLQLGDDLVGDFLIKARPVLAGASASGVSGHRGSPRRAPRASLASFKPVTENPSALSLSGRCGVSPQKGVCRRHRRRSGGRLSPTTRK